MNDIPKTTGLFISGVAVLEILTHPLDTKNWSEPEWPDAAVVVQTASSASANTAGITFVSTVTDVEFEAPAHKTQPRPAFRAPKS